MKRQLFFSISFSLIALSCQTSKKKAAFPTEEFDEQRENKQLLGEFRDFPEPKPSLQLHVEDTKLNTDSLQTIIKVLRKYRDAVALETPASLNKYKNRFSFIDERLNLNALFSEFHINSSLIENIDFSIPKLSYNHAVGEGIVPLRYFPIFSNTQMKAIVFKNVNLSNLNFSSSKFINVRFENVNFDTSIFLNAEFENVTFSNCNFRYTDLSFSKGHNVTLENNNFDKAKVDFSNWKNVNFHSSSIALTEAVNSNIKVLSEKNEDEKKSTLKIGLVFASTFRGVTANKIYEDIFKRNYIPVTIEYRIPFYINENELEQEVNQLKKKVNSKTRIAKQFLDNYNADKQSFPTLRKLEDYVSTYISELDAIVIPGGLDLEAYLALGIYNGSDDVYFDDIPMDKRKGLVASEKFPVRSFLEIFLIEKSREKKLPMFLICRGSQLYASYFGGHVVVDLASEYGITTQAHDRTLSKSEEEHNANSVSERYGAAPGAKLTSEITSLYNKYSDKGVIVYGNHHQAISPKKLPPNFKVLYVWLTDQISIPYLTVDQDYNFAILTQFHPEVKDDVGDLSALLSQFNTELFNLFYRYAMDFHNSNHVKPSASNTKLKPSSNHFTYYVRSPWIGRAVEAELSNARSWDRKGKNSVDCADAAKNPSKLPICCDEKHQTNCVKRDFFPVDYVHTDGKFRHPKGLSQNFYNPKLINRFSNDYKNLTDKDILLTRLREKKSFKPYELTQWSFGRKDSASLDQLLQVAYNEAEYLILKPAKGYGGKGIAIVKVNGTETSDAIRKHIDTADAKGYDEWVAQVYIGNPMLFKGKKFHFRLYLMVTKLFGEYKLYTSPQTWIYSALKPYGEPDDALKHFNDKQRHISSIEAGQTEHLFPQEILGDTYKGIPGPEIAKFLNEQFKLVFWESAADIVTKFNCPPGVDHCYDIYGADVMVDHNFKPKLLEFNGGVGYGDKTADRKYSDCWERQFTGAFLRKSVDLLFDTAPTKSLDTAECLSFDMEELNDKTVESAKNFVMEFHKTRLTRNEDF